MENVLERLNRRVEQAGTILKNLSLVTEGRIYDLSHVMEVGMPVFPFHVPYSIVLQNRHGDKERPGKTSYANEQLVLSAHSSTHVDAIGHFSRDGVVFGGKRAADMHSSTGITDLDATSIPIVFGRGVLLDICAVAGVDHLEIGQPIGPDLLSEASAGIEVGTGDVVLVRTGWSQLWEDPSTFNGTQGGYPGITPDSARWLIERQPLMVGSDTPAVEVSPPVGDSVHGMLLVDNGIFMIENMDLEVLARDGRREFLFVMSSIKIVGGTGSPVRPLAIV